MYAIILLLLFMSNVFATTNSRVEDLQTLLNRQGINITQTSCIVPNFSIDLLSLLRLAIGQQLDRSGHLRSPPNANFIPTPRTTLQLVRLGQRDYFFSKNQKATWLDARQFCLSFGMDLASVETAAENDLIYSHLASLDLNREPAFISGNKIGRENYIWVNEAPIVFQDWGRNQPEFFCHKELHDYV